MDKKFLETLIKTPSPSGREDILIKKVIDFQKAADNVIYDYQGGATMVFNQNSPFKIMLCAHADEISLIVKGYTNDGFLLVSNNGGIKPQVYAGSRVRIINDTKEVLGVVGFKHSDKLTCDDLFIDIGAKNKQEAAKLVALGSYVIHDSDLSYLNKDLITGRAFDDRLGIYVTQMAVKRAMELGCTNGLYATCATGEETTGRGAYSSCSIIQPNVCIVVDVTYSSDYIGAEGQDITLGEGGVICLGSIPNRKLNQMIEKIAHEKNLKVQYEVWAGRTCTDGDTILKATLGVPQVLFSIPLRYMHSPIEVASVKDLDSMVEILATLLVTLNQETSLNPYQD
jgi:endoglucanase